MGLKLPPIVGLLLGDPKSFAARFFLNLDLGQVDRALMAAFALGDPDGEKLARSIEVWLAGG